MNNICAVCRTECQGVYCSGKCRAKASRARAQESKAHAHAPKERTQVAHAPVRTAAHAVHILTKHDVGTFRGSPAYWLDKDTGLSHLSCDDLKHRLSAMNPWQGTPEYAERVYRLTHGLAANDIPSNMIGQDYA